MNVVTLWIAVDESSAENGCLRVVRGSHTEALQPLQKSASGGGDVLGSYTVATVDEKRVVEMEMQPGEIALCAHTGSVSVANLCEYTCAVQVMLKYTIPTLSTEVVLTSLPSDGAG